MRRNRTAVASATSLPRAPEEEVASRVRHYAITMTIRMACFALMLLVTPYGWYTWVFAIGAAVLPYIAVVIANAGSDSRQSGAEAPVAAIDAPGPIAQEPADEAPLIVTVHETTAHETTASETTVHERPAAEGEAR